MPGIEELVASGAIGGRTVQIVENGAVVCATYEPTPLPDGSVRIRTIRSAISPGTEMTFLGRDASNVYLHKTWNPELRLFEPGRPSLEYPVTFGYRAAGEVVESRAPGIEVGRRVFGSWRHTELTAIPGEQARDQTLPDELTWDDGVDLAQMGPIALNATLFAADEHLDRDVVVFGAGPVGLITAQFARDQGARPTVVDRIPERLEIARGLGLETFEAAEGVDVAASLKREHGADAIPVAWECTGSTFALNEAIRVVRRQGLVIAVGFYQGEGRGLLLGDEFHHNGIRVVCGQIGNAYGDWTNERLRAAVLASAVGGNVVLGALPRLTLPVEQAAEAFHALTRPAEVLQTVLTYD